MDMSLVYGLALVPGLYQCLVFVVNRVQATNLPPRFVHVVEKLHGLGLIVAPPLAVWLSQRPPSVAAANIWSAAWLTLVALSLAGWLVLVRNAVWWWTKGRPQHVVSVESQILHTSHELKPLGRGWTRFPGNQCWQCEFVEMSVALPRVPPAWNGFKILHLSDFHFEGSLPRQYFERLIEAAHRWQPDIAVFTGDLFDDPKLIDWADNTLGRAQARYGRFFVLGNHDWRTHATAEIRSRLTALGWTDASAAATTLDIAGHRLEIAGDERPWLQHAEFTKPEAFRLLLSHAPDRIDAARASGVDLMLAGHTHGGQIRLPVLGPIYSPSRYGVEYASGTFWKPPTLMHVSRGVSGAKPIRYLCPPEITRIELRSPGAVSGEHRSSI